MNDELTMLDLGRLMIILGGVLTLLGGLVYVLARFGFRGLPGDVNYRSPHVLFYFPVVSCLVVSMLLAAGSWLFRWLSGK